MVVRHPARSARPGHLSARHLPPKCPPHPSCARSRCDFRQQCISLFRPRGSASSSGNRSIDWRPAGQAVKCRPRSTWNRHHLVARKTIEKFILFARSKQLEKNHSSHPGSIYASRATPDEKNALSASPSSSRGCTRRAWALQPHPVSTARQYTSCFPQRIQIVHRQ